ncbi:MAG: hypothetical protein J6D28_04480 [Bacilli bacterium]|nr:hypothetical protein [Bacilli bacterium]
MYLKIDEDLYKKISNITCTDYEKKGDFMPADSIIPMLEDLLVEIDHQKEKYEDLERDLEDNHRPISVSEQVGISDKDFM